MRAGELCAGYGGLALAVEEVFGAETAWFSEFDPAPSKILAHHWPEVPNHGDMTKIDWASIEQVDIISGGTPCQDLSHAGKRKGMTEGTRSNLWVTMREAIAIQQPEWVAWENVRGAYSAEADSDLEQCPRCMGDAADGRAVLRALGRVLGDLSDLGFDAEWRGLRAADVGACHPRFRVFILAHDTSRLRRNKAFQHNGSSPQDDNRAGVPDESDSFARWAGSLGETTADRDHLGNNRARERAKQDRRGQLAHGRKPAADAESIGRGEGWTQPAGIIRGLPTSSDSAPTQSWGAYAAAIRRWEAVMGRRAPSPTEPTGRDQGHRLSPRFTEWMMGLPDGWVTDPAIGISRNDQLKACGNGVVPQQAAAALRDMLAAFQARERKAA